MMVSPEPWSQIEAYETVPISFVVHSRLDVPELLKGNYLEIPVEPWTKDYDQLERPSHLPKVFDVTNWTILSAFDGDQRLGGAIVARDTPGVDMLQGRTDLACIFDIRVAKQARGQGIGRLLFQTTEAWAKNNGCTELVVETQDINVAACHFYAAMGCHIVSAEHGAYSPELDEAKLIWSKWL